MITECHTELLFFVFFSSRRRHTRYWHDWSSDVCSSDLAAGALGGGGPGGDLVEVPEDAGRRAERHPFEVELGGDHLPAAVLRPHEHVGRHPHVLVVEIGRASCRERV